MGTSNRYSPEVRERAVRLVRGHQAEHPSQVVALGLAAEPPPGSTVPAA